jgi:hypothetical protein
MGKLRAHLMIILLSSLLSAQNSEYTLLPKWMTKDDIKECYLRSIFLTPNTHTCFYFEVSLNISSESLLSRFSTENKDQDIQSLKVLSQEEYVSFLRNHSSPAKQFISEIINI